MVSPQRLALLAVVAAIYFVSGRFGLSLAFVNQSTSAIWPPTGIAIAAGLLAGVWVWPGVLAGAFLVNLTTTGAVVPSLVIAVGNTTEMLLAVGLAGRYAGGAAGFEKTGHLVTFVLIASVAAAVAATLGLAALTLGGLSRGSDPAMTWLTWWTGDLSSALILTPTLVAWTRPGMRFPTRRRLLEATLLVMLVAVASYWVYGPTAAGSRSYPLMFVLLPVLLWASLSFGQRGTTAAMLITTVGAAGGTLQGYGPFARWSPNESLLLLQAYLCVKSIVMLSLACEVEARRAAEGQLRDVNAGLADRVESRSRELLLLHGRLVEAQHVAHIGSWEWDVAANAIWWSDEMYRIFGLPVGSPVNYERYLSMVHPDDRSTVQDAVARSTETGEPFMFEHRTIRFDGSVRTLHAQGRVVREEDGRVVRMLGVGYDITDRKRAEEERLALVREQAARLEAEEASRMKDRFLATLSHELRTPLNAIQGWTQMLRNYALEEELRRRALDAIHRNVRIQAQLVSDILDVAHINRGTISLDVKPVPVGLIIGGALDMMRPAIDSKGIQVSVDVPDGIAVNGDPQRLQQVFWNVFSNAAKFVPPGGTIGVSAKRDDGMVEIATADNGPGIDDAFLPYVFEQFRQADSSSTREYGGLGLGLSISRDLVHLHGGTISAANRREGGAVFTVRLPAVL